MWQIRGRAARIEATTRWVRSMKVSFFGAARTVLAFSTILLIPPVGARAADSLLIWSPTKISSYAYRLRMGVKAATGNPVSGGVDFSVAASSAGRINATRDNARFWAEMRGQGGSGVERTVTAGYNPATGRASASAGITRRWLAFPSVDLVLAPSVSVESHTRHGYDGSMRITQRALIQLSGSGTSVLATGTAARGQRRIGTEIRVEQRVFEGLDVAASVRRQDASAVGAVKATFRVSW